MQDFVIKFQSFDGISDIIGKRDKKDILSIVSSITQIEKEKLKELETDTLGKAREKRRYIDVITELKHLSPFIGKLYSALGDESSKNTLFSMLKYWLIPDAAFLKEAFSEIEEAEPSSALLTIQNTDEIKQHIELIRDMKCGEVIRFKIGSALNSIFTAYELLSILKNDLSFSLCMKDTENVVLCAMSPLPKIEVLKKRKDRLKVVSIAKDPDAWRNEELLKDKGLVPYLLHKDMGYESFMVGVKNGEYTYLSDYLSGMDMEFLPDGSKEAKCKWIEDNAEDVDILIVNGLYPVNMDIMRIFKEKNPKGLTYLPLDANSEWMDRILHTNEAFSALIGNVDVIGSSGKRMQEHLNVKWRHPIEYFPNGYYHPWIKIDAVDYSEKENVILTVGRLGTEQKATEVMLEAFAKAAPFIPDYSLRLVGSIEPGFEQFIEDFFLMYPELRERISFVGKITDKAELFNEYKRAKVFTLTSILEGGTPNVVAEALHSGCAMAVTEFDAYADATAKGKCGMSAAIGDDAGMAEVYKTLCSNDDSLKEMCLYAQRYAEMYFSMEKVTRRIHESLSEVV